MARSEGVHASLGSGARGLGDHRWEAGGTWDEAGGGGVVRRLEDFLLEFLLDTLVFTGLVDGVALGVGDPARADADGEFKGVDEAGNRVRRVILSWRQRLFLPENNTESKESLRLIAESDVALRVGDIAALCDVPRWAGLGSLRV